MIVQAHPTPDLLFQTIEKLPTTMNDIDPVEFGRMQADVHMLKTEMSEVRRDVKELLEMANRGRGGLWMFNSGLVAAGGVLAWAVDHFFLKGPVK